ncbi:hypothetical protein [Fusobacterium sp.]|uniref:hypothetical protein n=1 Tax=Fusobacterium sp. TaxID=68766 RepID=UPI0029041A2D|nr:hypothetical protein [Fusobacterium sp.]MDU1912494.1 hypothetical protein [Fusobacterium sp.]
MNIKFRIFGEKKLIEIDENLYKYIFDSLKWANSYYNKKMTVKGINLKGNTYFDKKGMIELRSIIKTWIEIFSYSPENFILYGDYNLEDNAYQENSFIKKNILSQLKELIKKIDEAILKNELLVFTRENY